MNPDKVYIEIARALGALDRISKNPNGYMRGAGDRQRDRLAQIMESAPSGSGIDAGVELLESESSPDKLVFRVDFHHMNDSGFYDGWTHHRAIVRPSLEWGFTLRITGRNKRGIKEWLEQVMGDWLESNAPEWTMPGESDRPGDLPPELAF